MQAWCHTGWEVLHPCIRSGRNLAQLIWPELALLFTRTFQFLGSARPLPRCYTSLLLLLRLAASCLLPRPL